MLLRVLLTVRFDLLHPCWIRLGVEDCDDDHGRAASYGDFGNVD